MSDAHDSVAMCRPAHPTVCLVACDDVAGQDPWCKVYPVLAISLSKCGNFELVINPEEDGNDSLIRFSQHMDLLERSKSPTTRYSSCVLTFLGEIDHRKINAETQSMIRILKKMREEQS